MNWEYKSLDELGTISRGRSKHRPRNDDTMFGGKYPFVQTADVKNANLYLTEYENTYNDKGLEQSKLWKAGTLCITIAANIADTAILGMDACFPDSIMGFIPYDGIANVRFVKYAFDMLQRDCKQISQGTAQDNLSWQKLSAIRFPAPDIEVQDRIVRYLSVYDDLIENNKRQIKLLEEATQRLYKEWFVDLHFPGYENVKIVDGVPEGWRKDRADSFFNITIGKTPPRAEKQWFAGANDGVPWVSISDMGNSRIFIFKTNEGITAEAVKKHNMKVVPIGTILVSFKLTVGRVAIAANEMCTNEAIAHFDINNNEQRAYAYCYLCNFEYDTLGNTSSISKAVNSKIIKSMPFVMPTEKIIKEFSNIVMPILDEIKKKQEMCIKLEEMRNRLLPKLMGGEFNFIVDKQMI